MCFMAQTDNEASDIESNSLISYEEQENAFEELYNDFKKLASKYNTIKKET